MEDFVPFELAIKLREKGFREDCIAYYHTDGELIYNSDEYRGGDYRSLLMSYNSLPKNPVGCEQIDAPTIPQTLKWLRDVKRIVVEINCNYTDYFPTVRLLDYHQTDYISGCDIYTSYEEAALAGIEHVLDNLI